MKCGCYTHASCASNLKLQKFQHSGNSETIVSKRTFRENYYKINRLMTEENLEKDLVVSTVYF